MRSGAITPATNLGMPTASLGRVPSSIPSEYRFGTFGGLNFSADLPILKVP